MRWNLFSELKVFQYHKAEYLKGITQSKYKMQNNYINLLAEWMHYDVLFLFLKNSFPLGVRD
jgi:hypothetical protein